MTNPFDEIGNRLQLMSRLLQGSIEALQTQAEDVLGDALGLSVLIDQVVVVCREYHLVKGPVYIAQCLDAVVTELEYINRNAILERLGGWHLQMPDGRQDSVFKVFAEILLLAKDFRHAAVSELDPEELRLSVSEDEPASPGLRQAIRSLMDSTVPLITEVRRHLALLDTGRADYSEVFRIGNETLDALHLMLKNLADAARVQTFNYQTGYLSSASQFVVPLQSSQLTIFADAVSRPDLDKRIAEAASQVGALSNWPDPRFARSDEDARPPEPLDAPATSAGPLDELKAIFDALIVLNSEIGDRSGHIDLGTDEGRGLLAVFNSISDGIRSAEGYLDAAYRNPTNERAAEFLTLASNELRGVAPSSELVDDRYSVPSFRMRFQSLLLRLEALLNAPPFSKDEVRQDSLPSRVEELTREQEIAPFQYQLTETALSIAPVRAEYFENFGKFAGAQKDYLIEQNARIAKTLEVTNVSPTLKGVFSGIAARLDNETKVLQLGQELWTAQKVLAAEEAALMDPIVAELRSHLVALEQYLNRFQDWREFVNDSVSVMVSDDDEALLTTAALEISKRLEAIPIVDPEVPVSLNQAANWPVLHDQHRGGRILARLRTLGNMVSAVFKNVGQWAVDDVKKQIGRAIVDNISHRALEVFHYVRDMDWVRHVIEVARHWLSL